MEKNSDFLLFFGLIAGLFIIILVFILSPVWKDKSIVMENCLSRWKESNFEAKWDSKNGCLVKTEHGWILEKYIVVEM